MNFVARGCMYCEGECNKECLKEAAEKLKGRELFKESNDRARKMLSEVKSLPIVETLEEAAKKYADIPLKTIIDSEERYFNSNVRDYDSFIEGAKWQAERMYSEEETYRILHKLMMEIHIDGLLIADDTDLKMWFEQFKKK